MSEPRDTPVVTRDLCPGCEPDYDPRSLIEVRFCHQHEPERTGIEDIHWEYPGIENGEAGGASNKAICDFFHRKVV